MFVDHPQGVDHALCERVTDVLRDYLSEYAIDVSSPGTEPPLRRRPHFERAVGRTVALRTADNEAQGPRASSSPPASARFSVDADKGEPVEIPYELDRAGQPDRGRNEMTREIIEAVRVIEKEKGIDGDTLIHALEDALLAAYKKTPGASRHATVELDDEGDFRVYSIELPPTSRSG